MALSSDPSLRGIVTAMSYINQGVRAKAGTFDDFDRPMVEFGNALEGVLAGRLVYFSWRSLISGQPPDPRELRRFIEVQPNLGLQDYLGHRSISSTVRYTELDAGKKAHAMRRRR